MLDGFYEITQWDKQINYEPPRNYNVITKPKHYHINVKDTSGRVVEIDCLAVTKALGLTKRHFLASALAYVWRCTKKGTEKNDIEKAIFYLNLAKAELDETNQDDK